jgi:hypothetical protein
MNWYLVIGVEPGNLRTGACVSRRWHSVSAVEAARAFFEDEPAWRRCIVTLIDTSAHGPQTPVVFDRLYPPPARSLVARR